VAVIETSSEIVTAHVTTRPNSRKNCPTIPLTNAIGRNTAQIENVLATTARPTSRVPSRAAVMESSPISSMRRKMFSSTTMASSTSIPIERERHQRHHVEGEAQEVRRG
jgi:hypothetical protein